MPAPDQIVRWPDGTEATWEEVERGDYSWMSDDYELVPEPPEFADPDCPGCRGGDKVPFDEDYWRCPKCDAEWFDDHEAVIDPRDR